MIPNNSRILLIAPKYYGYELEIQKELSLHGNVVYFLSDRPFDSSFLKAIFRLYPKLLRPFMNWHYKREFNSLVDKNIDYVFVIQGEGLSPTSLVHARSIFRSAQFIYYIWDSIVNKPAFVDNFAYFDKSFTFDKGDAIRFRINYRPLFYTKQYEADVNIISNYDLSFVGTAHSDRVSLLNAIKHSIGNNKTSFIYLYLQSKWLFCLYKIFNRSFRGSKLSDFQFYPLSINDAAAVFMHSRVILDIEHPNQKGITIRTLEALGADKKIITTNHEIRYEDFYDSNNILILKRGSDILINDDFFIKPYVPVDPKIKGKYTLNGWLTSIFD